MADLVYLVTFFKAFFHPFDTILVLSGQTLILKIQL